jgi:predicted dehydrogenase
LADPARLLHSSPIAANEQHDGPVQVGVVGLGYWGPNLARNFDRLPETELRWICDGSDQSRTRWAPHFPNARVSGDLEELLADPELDAVVIATPVPTHAALAQRVMEGGKHCFVEKPVAQSVADAEAVAATAKETGRVLMVGHLLEYHPGVEKLKQIADSGDLGELHYLYSNRLNLGKLRADENSCSPARSRPRSRRSARATCARASRTSCSATSGSRPGSPPTSTCRGSTRTRSAG